ncbi:hypothetical protein FRB96_004926 [Tulasnella sp. 330]|nr:hypothetical protein FRB96_004926 [Tulasnella sp. 330]KAG8873405.1 hypothetical protein FRB97_006745 [Tulasnella sp. 331]KAG8877969.1 hypothetical protein FRB98_006425 [Tulasnella sp. 332]
MSEGSTPVPRTPRQLRGHPPSPIHLASSGPSSLQAGLLSPNPSTPGLPSSPNLGSAPVTPTGKGRARDLLRKHYGLGIGVPAPTGNPADPMDIDSSAFDAKAYYDQLITVSSLPALLKRDNELVSEIRQLESDRQALVYNHHHELIAASDTIRAMKIRAESLDVDLEKLKAAFSEISRLSSEVTDEPNSSKN